MCACVCVLIYKVGICYYGFFLLFLSVYHSPSKYFVVGILMHISDYWGSQASLYVFLLLRTAYRHLPFSLELILTILAIYVTIFFSTLFLVLWLCNDVIWSWCNFTYCWYVRITTIYFYLCSTRIQYNACNRIGDQQIFVEWMCGLKIHHLILECPVCWG